MRLPVIKKCGKYRPILFIIFAHGIFTVNVCSTVKKGERRKLGQGQVPGSLAQGKTCAACLAGDDRDVEQCPLLVDIATGRDEDIKKAKAVCQGAPRVKEANTNPREWANAHEQA